jgi:DnaJ family protein C protein 28
MDFTDWRKTPDGQTADSETSRSRAKKYYGRRFEDYIAEQIREAEARGEFDNLRGIGKPLNLDENLYAGDKAMGYGLLKSNGYAPKEIELAKEIRSELERMETKLAKLCHQGRTLRSRRVPPFASEKRAFNNSVEKTALEYERVLRELNSQILTLNLMAPAVMHQPVLDVEKLIQNFREACPLFD